MGQEKLYGQTDATGYYRIEGLGTGEVALQAHALVDGRGDVTRRARVELAEGLVMRVDFEFSGGLQLTGRLDGYESGLVGSVTVFADVDEQTLTDPNLDFETMIELQQCCLVTAAQVEADGQFVVRGVEPGTYTWLGTAFDQGLQQSGNTELILQSMLRAVETVTVAEGGVAEVVFELR